MAVNVEINRNANETSLSILRRFTKRVQGSGVLPRVRGLRYHERVKSENVQKSKKITKLATWAKTAELVKLGKIADPALNVRGRKKR